jgi:hypothetical protein
MPSVSGAAFAPSNKTARRVFSLGEESFGSILTDIAVMLWPPPKTAAQVAAAIGCGERNAELCLAGKQNWSGDAVAAIVAEILKRHGMRNARVVAR